MKALLSISMLLVISISMHGQWTTGTGKTYADPLTTKVGIGTSVPLEELHLKNSTGDSWIQAIIESSNSSAGIKLINNNNQIWEIQSCVHSTGKVSDNFVIYDRTEGGTDGYRLVIDKNGNVRIGTNNSDPNYKLSVNGKIRANEIVVNTGWADFVFEKNYKLPSLFEIEEYINEYKHLPGVPTEEDVKNNGVPVGEMNSMLLQKVEELTLYVIDLQKQIDRQNSTISKLTTQND